MLNSIINFVIFLVAIEAFEIMLLEMFGNQTNVAAKDFSISPEILKQKDVQIMMKNQGLYNGFLGIGILISKFILQNDPSVLMFIIFVIVAAIYGALTVNKKIIFTQGALPIIALILILMAG